MLKSGRREPRKELGPPRVPLTLNRPPAPLRSGGETSARLSQWRCVFITCSWSQFKQHNTQVNSYSFLFVYVYCTLLKIVGIVLYRSILYPRAHLLTVFSKM